jgi:cytochrome c-type biogenesis protein CcmH
MVLWLLLAVLTAGVVYALLTPVLRPHVQTTDGRAADIAVYRDQLAQIEDDARRGVVEAADVESAKLEVARRILKSAKLGMSTTDSPADTPAENERYTRIILGIVGTVPVLAIAMYMTIGSPWLVSKPYAGGGRPVTETAELTELVQRVEARLRQFPEDGRGWDVIAPVYFKSERFDDAAKAYSTAARILGETPARLAGFAEAHVLANGGRVGPEARAAYQKILAAEPGRFEPRFWLALGREQDGDKAAALTEYEALIKLDSVSPEGRAVIAERIALLGGKPLIPPTQIIAPNAGTLPAPFKGPSAADVKAAGEMSEDDRLKMINSMVDGLAERLKTNGKDAAGWQRLIQSYVMLGRREQAKTAVADARKNLAAEPSAVAEIVALAKTLKLDQ